MIVARAIYISSKLDRLFQNSNDARTNGIPIGPAISDLIAELILADIDEKISANLPGLEFVATRFKDDYRILTKSEDDAKKIRVLTS